MKANYNLTKFTKKYKGLWIALDNSSNKVLSSGKDVVLVYKKAKKKENNPILFKVPKDNIAFAGRIKDEF